MTVTLKFLKSFDWEELVNRNEAVFCLSITHLGYLRSPVVTGLSWRPRAIFNIGGGSYYYLAGDLAKLRTMLVGKRLRFFSRFRSRLLRAMRNLETVARQIESTDCSALSHESLRALLKRYLEAAYAAHCFLAPLPIADKVLEQEILDRLPAASESTRQQWLYALTFPDKENEHTREERSFYRLAAAYHSRQFPRLIQKHLSSFAWIGARWYWWKHSWTERDVIERLKQLFSQGKNPRAELRALDVLRRQQRTARRRLMKRLRIRPRSPLFHYLVLAREYAFLRTYRTDVVYGSGFRARNVFYEASHRAGLEDVNDVVYFTSREVLAMARSKRPPVTPAELNRRKRFNCLFTRGSLVTVLSGSAWKRRLARVVPKSRARTKLQGTPAFSGNARGRARVVLSTDDLPKVRRGDILVAVMTFPHLIAAMEKAAAFVTDEGGILCHAAIVAREMRKPCVIGTRVATRVLKTGDRVEVDAKRGIVRKLSLSARSPAPNGAGRTKAL